VIFPLQRYRDIYLIIPAFYDGVVDSIVTPLVFVWLY
jgi:hypothetical protein